MLETLALFCIKVLYRQNCFFSLLSSGTRIHFCKLVCLFIFTDAVKGQATPISLVHIYRYVAKIELF